MRERAKAHPRGNQDCDQHQIWQESLNPFVVFGRRTDLYFFVCMRAGQSHLILCHQRGKTEANSTSDLGWELVIEAGQSQQGKNTAQNAQINVEQVLANLGPSHYETQCDDRHEQRSHTRYYQTKRAISSGFQRCLVLSLKINNVHQRRE
jgi:hypothetical protein